MVNCTYNFTMQFYKLQKVTVIISYVFLYCLLFKLSTTMHVQRERHGITISTLTEPFSKIKLQNYYMYI